MGLFPVSGLPAPVVISPVSRVALGVEIALGPTVADLGTTAGAARGYPVYLPEEMVLQKAWWLTGATPSGNVDVGLYDSNFQLIVSTGAAAIGAASSMAEVDIADMIVDRGTYYVVLAPSATQGTNLSVIAVGTGTQGAKATGMLSATSAHPLPTTLTPVVVAGSAVFIAGFTGRPLAA